MTDLFTILEPQPSGVPREVAEHFEKIAIALRKDHGFKRYSADAIAHRVRWHFQIERGNKHFKVNNNHISNLARWCMARHPELRGFFETREKTI